jgi:hypothetical protein
MYEASGYGIHRNISAVLAALPEIVVVGHRA